MNARVLSLFCFVAVAAHAETPVAKGFQLEARAVRTNAIYKVGEDISIEVKLTNDGKPADGEVSWTLTKDGVEPIINGKGNTTDGKITIHGKLGEPGFLQCRAAFRTMPGDPKSPVITALAGAGVDPTHIKPSQPVPDDFTQFWDAQKKKLAAVPANPKLTPVTSPSKTLDTFDLQADCIGAPVSGYFAKPKDAKPKSLPVVLTVHGAGVRSSGLGSAASWAQSGSLAMDVNAHGIPNGKPDEFYKELADGALKDYRSVGRDDREKCYFLGMFLRLVRAIDFLTSQPEWNGRDVIVFGSSQGGFQAFAAAGIDERVTFFAAGVPAGCDHTGVTVGRINGWPKLVPNLADGKPDPKVLEAARYFDNVNFAAHTHAKSAVVTVGFIDSTCPPTSVYAAYNALRIPKQIYNDIPHGHTNSPEAAAFMRNATMKILQHK